MNGQVQTSGGVSGQQSAALGMTQFQALNLNRVWVIMRDNHEQGLGSPIAAYRDKLSADRGMELLDHADGMFKCVEIEVW